MERKKQNGANVLNRETQKNYPGEYKNKQLRRTDKPRVSLAKGNRPDAELLHMLREGKKCFDIGKVFRSFQDYIRTRARNIKQINQKAVSTARKHQADPLITKY